MMRRKLFGFCVQLVTAAHPNHKEEPLMKSGAPLMQAFYGKRIRLYIFGHFIKVAIQIPESGLPSLKRS